MYSPYDVSKNFTIRITVGHKRLLLHKILNNVRERNREDCNERFGYLEEKRSTPTSSLERNAVVSIMNYMVVSSITLKVFYF